MIVRLWTTGVDPDRVDEYRAFATERSLQMFRSQGGFLGVLFTESESQFAVMSFWRDRGSAQALEASSSYQSTVQAITATGFLTGAQNVEIFEVVGGELTEAAGRAVHD